MQSPTRERMREKEGSKPNVVGVPNTSATFFRFAKSATRDRSDY
jgi:hypothetical protein